MENRKNDMTRHRSSKRGWSISTCISNSGCQVKIQTISMLYCRLVPI